MTVKPVLQLAAEIIESVVSDVTNGFNPAMANAASQYKVEPFSVDFDGGSNFWRSPFDVLDLYDNEFELPGMALFEAGDQNLNLVTSNVFSGPMQFQSDVHLAWRAEGFQHKFERMRWAVHDAMINVFSSSFAQQKFQITAIAFNGGIGMATPGQMTYVKDKGLWLQTLSFRIGVTAHVY
jgi:hypothetical protein